jgi:hypothetical protein
MTFSSTAVLLSGLFSHTSKFRQMWVVQCSHRLELTSISVMNGIGLILISEPLTWPRSAEATLCKISDLTFDQYLTSYIQIFSMSMSTSVSVSAPMSLSMSISIFIIYATWYTFPKKFGIVRKYFKIITKPQTLITTWTFSCVNLVDIGTLSNMINFYYC